MPDISSFSAPAFSFINRANFSSTMCRRQHNAVRLIRSISRRYKTQSQIVKRARPFEFRAGGFYPQRAVSERDVGSLVFENRLPSKRSRRRCLRARSRRFQRNVLRKSPPRPKPSNSRENRRIRFLNGCDKWRRPAQIARFEIGRRSREIFGRQPLENVIFGGETRVGREFYISRHRFLTL